MKQALHSFQLSQSFRSLRSSHSSHFPSGRKAEPSASPQILLAGMPNCGKSSLFNLLTGKHAYVGNRAGVTVEPEVAPFSSSTGLSGLLCDIPGITSLIPRSRDEEAAISCLLASVPHALINVMDVTDLSHQLPLTLRLARLCHEKSVPLILCLTMTDRLEKQGQHPDTQALSEWIGAPVFTISARKKATLSPLIAQIGVALSKKQSAYRMPPSLTAENPGAEYIQKVCQHVILGDKAEQRTAAKLDHLFCGASALPIFLGIMAAVMYLTFGHPGNLLCDGLSYLLRSALNGVSRHLFSEGTSAIPFAKLLFEGISDGLCATFSFFPRILILSLCLAILEDCGYMARVSSVTDPLMHRVGLDGRACVSFLLGLGCTVPAILSCRTMCDCRERRLCCSVLPLISCSARIPVYSLIAQNFFGQFGWLVALAVHLLGFVMVFFLCAIAQFRRKTRLFCRPSPLPPLRSVHFLSAWKVALREALLFLRRAGIVIFLVTLVLGLSLHISPSFAFCSPEESIPAFLGSRIAFLFAPAGFGSWEACTALICGIGAKEAVISALTVLCPAPGGFAPQLIFTPASALSFLVFFSMYCPCSASLVTLKKEIGFPKTMLCALQSFLCAYFCALCIYRLSLLFF